MPMLPPLFSPSLSFLAMLVASTTLGSQGHHLYSLGRCVSAFAGSQHSWYSGSTAEEVKRATAAPCEWCPQCIIAAYDG